MKKIFKLIISMLTILTLSIGLLCFAGCKTETILKENKASIEINNDISNGIKLASFKSVIVDNGTEKYLEELLTATVTKAGATTDFLIWDVYWNDKTVTANIKDYLTVTPDINNGNVASVKCFANFEDYGSATVEVKSSSDSNVKATCIVSYKGIPTALSIMNKGTVISGTTVMLNDGGILSYDLVLEHLLGAGKDYSNFDINVKMDGIITLNCEVYSNGVASFNKVVYASAVGSSTMDIETPTGKVNCSLEEFLDWNNYLLYSFINGELVLSSQKLATKLFNGLDGKESYNGKVNPDNGVKAMLTDYDITFNVTITEKTSNLTSSFNVKVKADLSNIKITNIDLDKSVIEF